MKCDKATAANKRATLAKAVKKMTIARLIVAIKKAEETRYKERSSGYRYTLTDMAASILANTVGARLWTERHCKNIRTALKYCQMQSDGFDETPHRDMAHMIKLSVRNNGNLAAGEGVVNPWF